MSQRGTGARMEALAGLWSRRKWMAIAAFAWVLSAALCVTAALPNVYTASATLLVEREKVSESIVKPSLNGALDTRLQTINQELLSRSRLLGLMDRFDLYPEARAAETPEEVLIERMRREIDVEVRSADLAHGGRETVAFTIGFHSKDPALAAEVANTLAAFYVEENVRTREEQTIRTTSFLAGELEEARRRLDGQARLLEEFNARHMGALPQQVGANLATLERLNTQLELNLEQQLRAAERNDRLVRESGADADARPAGESPGDRLARLEDQLVELRSRYSEKHPDVLQARAEIEALRKEIAGGALRKREEPAARGPASARPGDLAALQQEEQRIRAALARYQDRIESVPEVDQELREITRAYEVAKQHYESLLARDEEARLSRKLEAGRLGEQFRILDPAVPPGAPSAPDRLRLLVLGLLASIGAAAGLVALLERCDTSFHTVESVRAFTTVPVLASIPRIGTRSDSLRRGLRAAAATFAVVLGMGLTSAALWYLARDNEGLVGLISRGAS